MPDSDALRLALLHLDLAAVDAALADGASLKDPILGHAVLPLLMRHRANVGEDAVRAFIAPLVQRGADVNALDDEGRSVLALASQQRDGETIRVLTDLGARFVGPLPKGHHGESLDLAVQSLHLDLVDRLIAAGHPVPTPEATDGMGFSLLHTWASAQPSERPHDQGQALLTRLLEWGLPVNGRHRVTHATPLMLAVRNQSLHQVDLLLAAGADPRVGMVATLTPGLSVRDYTPLHWAAAKNDAPLVQRLLDAGADPLALVALSHEPVLEHDRITPMSEARRHEATASLALLEAAVLHQGFDRDARRVGRPAPSTGRPRL